MRRKGFAPVFILVVIAGVLISASGFYFYLHNRNLSLASSDQSSATVLGTTSSSTYDFEVLYTDKGFVPDLFDVPVGSRVAFKNTTDMALSVAADPYPAHTDYPEFNADKNYGLGEAYIFKFERAGTFGFHNDEKTADRGFIHVIDPTSTVPDIDKTQLGQQAIRDKLLAMFDPHDPNSIFKIVDAIQSDPVLSLNCHDIAHDIGHRAYELYGFSEAMTFSNPNHLKHTLVQYICAGGYMHGIVEELSLHEPSFKAQPDQVCAGIPDADRPSCYHGVGHAFMFLEGRNASSALADCRGIAATADMYRCFEGTWMELFWGNTNHSGPNTLGWDLDKPLAPCIAAKADEKPTCFLYSTFGYLRTHVKDYFGAVKMCTMRDLTNTDAGFCLQGLGITMMSKFRGQHLEGSEIYVDGLSAENKTAFYRGVMGYARLSGFSKSDLEASCNLLKNDTAICLAVVDGTK